MAAECVELNIRSSESTRSVEEEVLAGGGVVSKTMIADGELFSEKIEHSVRERLI